MRGRVVYGGREIEMPVTVFGGFASDLSRRISVEVEAVIDTGFTGHLTLPPVVVCSLNLSERGFVEVELADGSAAAFGLPSFYVFPFGHYYPVF